MRRQLRLQAFLQGFVHGPNHPFSRLRTPHMPHLRACGGKGRHHRTKEDRSYRNPTRRPIEFRHSPSNSINRCQVLRLQKTPSFDRAPAVLRLSYAHQVLRMKAKDRKVVRIPQTFQRHRRSNTGNSSSSRGGPRTAHCPIAWWARNSPFPGPSAFALYLR